MFTDLTSHTNGSSIDTRYEENTQATGLEPIVNETIENYLLRLFSYFNIDRSPLDPEEPISGETRTFIPKSLGGNYVFEIDPEVDEMFLTIIDSLLNMYSQKLAAERRVYDLENTMGSLSKALEHFFRTPITITNTNIYLIERQLRTIIPDEKMLEPIMARIETIRNQGETSVAIGDSIIRYLSLVSNSTESDITEVTASVIFDRMKELIQRKDKYKGKSIQVLNQIESDPKLSIDIKELTEAIFHFIDNGLDFEAQEVRLSFSEEENYIVIDISDDGIGMSEDTVQRMFDPLFKANTAGTLLKHGTGLGVGAKIAKQLIENNAGSVSIYSEEGVGTTVRILIPKVV